MSLGAESEGPRVGAVRPARAADLPACAELYLHGFERGLRALFGRVPHVALVEDIVGTYLALEPEGFLVWSGGARVDGYLLVTRSLRRLTRRAIFSHHAPRMILRFARGRYALGGTRALVHALGQIRTFNHFAGDFRSSGDAQIVSIAVREGVRGGGVGRELMRAARRRQSSPDRRGPDDDGARHGSGGAVLEERGPVDAGGQSLGPRARHDVSAGARRSEGGGVRGVMRRSR